MGFFSKLFGTGDTAGAQLPAEASNGEDVLPDTGLAKTILAELDIDRAIAAHENWKQRLVDYLDGKSTEELKPEVICLDDRCDLGKWLHGAGNARLGGYPAFSMLVARHLYFHQQAANVVAFAQSGERDRANQTLNSSYRHASNQVLLLLKELKRGLGR